MYVTVKGFNVATGLQLFEVHCCLFSLNLPGFPTSATWSLKIMTQCVTKRGWPCVLVRTVQRVLYEPQFTVYTVLGSRIHETGWQFFATVQ